MNIITGLIAAIILGATISYLRRPARTFDNVEKEEDASGEKKGGLAKLCKDTLGSNRMIFIAMWLLLIGIVYYLHKTWWEMWYGEGEGSPLFWMSQVIVIFTITAMPKKGFFRAGVGLSLALAIFFSFYSGFVGKAVEKGLVTGRTSAGTSTTPLHPTQGTWRFCWEEPDRTKTFNSERQKAPCAPGPKIKRVVKIKEYNSARFVFTISWKEQGVFKERSLFTWDKIANPKHGTWHQLSSEVKDSGKWRLVKRGGMFVGWHSSRMHGDREFMTTMEVLEKGLVVGHATMGHQAEQEWTISFPAYNDKFRATVVIDKGIFRMLQYSRFRGNESKATYTGTCSGSVCKGTYWSENDIAFQSGDFELEFLGDGSVAVGHGKGHPVAGKKKPKKYEFRLELVS